MLAASCNSHSYRPPPPPPWTWRGFLWFSCSQLLLDRHMQYGGDLIQSDICIVLRSSLIRTIHEDFIISLSFRHSAVKDRFSISLFCSTGWHSRRSGHWLCTLHACSLLVPTSWRSSRSGCSDILSICVYLYLFLSICICQIYPCFFAIFLFESGSFLASVH